MFSLNEWIQKTSEELILSKCPSVIEKDIWRTLLDDQRHKLYTEWPGVDFYANMISVFLNAESYSLAQSAFLKQSSMMFNTLIDNSSLRIENIMREMLQKTNIASKKHDELIRSVTREFVTASIPFIEQYQKIINSLN